MMKKLLRITGVFLVVFFLLFNVSADALSGSETVFPGADNSTPSRSEYFSWLNNTNEGATEKQTLTNLRFFKWLHQNYGMTLDIYAFDAGAIDGPRNHYGSMTSQKFKSQFPNGFGPIVKEAASMNTRMGIWGGPGGFGNSKESAEARINMMVRLCREFHWALFKFDAVCGQLPRDKEKYFIKMMQECRKYSPDLILLNHRLKLSSEAEKYSTTFLMGGKETYIDFHMTNSMTCPHHRGEAISRHPSTGLRRLTEDHGVCFNSALDGWDDDLILQAFNRSLILAPELYGNVWSLKDSEFPKLARIFNLHRRYRRILVNGKMLPKSYGSDAVSRGDDSSRFVTLRNLSWNPKRISIKLNEEIGLKRSEKIYVQQFHPVECFIGVFNYNDTVEVEVAPFRSALFFLTSSKPNFLRVEGTPYQVIKDMKGAPAVVELLGMPGSRTKIKLYTEENRFRTAELDGKTVNQLLEGGEIAISFPGTPVLKPYHRKLTDLSECAFPNDAETLYETTVYSADNNAAETDAIKRSGPSAIPQVQAARDAFYNQPLFITRALWDRFMFDGKPESVFASKRKYLINGGALRIDFGKIISADRIELQCKGEFPDTNRPLAEISEDLKKWSELKIAGSHNLTIAVPKNMKFRYLRIKGFKLPVSEVYAYLGNRQLDRSHWCGSNLFSPFEKLQYSKAWSGKINIKEAAPGSYLCVALEGRHGFEGAYVAIKRANGAYIGAPDRSPVYPLNPWESRPHIHKQNTTYYIPVTEDMLNKDLTVYVLGRKEANIHPSVWLTRLNPPYIKKRLILK